MKRLIFSIAMIISLGFSSIILGQDDDPTKCMLALEKSFFQYDVVSVMLSLYQIPQGVWEPLILDLQKKALSVNQRMKKKVANDVPNPLEYPVNKEAARQLLKETLYDVFLEALNESTLLNVQNAFSLSDQLISDMFEYIYNQQESKFIDCFGP